MKILSAFLITILTTIFSINTVVAINSPGVGVGQGGAPVAVTNIQGVSGIFIVLQNILGWTYAIFFIIAAFFILYAAFTYLTAKGDPEKVAGARDQIIYAVIAIVVALLAFSIDRIMATFLISGT